MGIEITILHFLFCLAAAVAYDDYSAKDHDGGKNFLPCECVHAYAYADDYRDYWLGIAIHAYECRSDALLSDGYQEVGYECCAYNQICQFSQLN